MSGKSVVSNGCWLFLLFFTVKALKVIGKTLEKTSWDFTFDPCDMASPGSGWRNPDAVKGSEDAITCDCSFLNGTMCHVTSM